MRLYKLIIRMRRSADLTAVGVLDDEAWAQIQDHAGAELYFGEVAGKHSEVTWPLDPAALEILSEDETEIALFMKWFPAGGVGQIDVVNAIELLHERLEEGESCEKCGFAYGDGDEAEEIEG